MLKACALVRMVYVCNIVKRLRNLIYRLLLCERKKKAFGLLYRKFSFALTQTHSGTSDLMTNLSGHVYLDPFSKITKQTANQMRVCACDELANSFLYRGYHGEIAQSQKPRKKHTLNSFQTKIYVCFSINTRYECKCIVCIVV